MTGICSCDNTWPSHIVYNFNRFTNVCNFWRVVLNGSAVTKLLPQKNVSHNILPTPEKNGEFQVNMQRIIGNAGSLSELLIDLRKILNIERQDRAWIQLCLLSYGWYAYYYMNGMVFFGA